LKSSHRLLSSFILGLLASCGGAQRSGTGAESPEAEAPPPTPEALCLAGDHDRCCELALELAVEDAPEGESRARGLLEGACEAEHPRACTLLGDLYSWAYCEAGSVWGPSPPRRCVRRRALSMASDMTYQVAEARRAAVLHDHACELGDQLGCVRRGQRISNAEDGDDALALELLEGACEAGELFGCVELGQHLGHRSRDQEDLVVAYGRACDGGLASGCLHLAEVLDRHDASAENLTRAAVAAERACDAGLARGCEKSGEMLLEGRGVAQDDELAVTRLVRALGGDAPNARVYLSGIEHEGRATVTYERLCGEGSGLACFRLGFLFHSGAGVEGGANTTRSLELFGRACELGVGTACANIGLMHDDGQAGYAEDHEAARQHYRRGCEFGSTLACARLGARWQYGELGPSGRFQGMDRDALKVLLVENSVTGELELLFYVSVFGAARIRPEPWMQIQCAEQPTVGLAESHIGLRAPAGMELAVSRDYDRTSGWELFLVGMREVPSDYELSLRFDRIDRDGLEAAGRISIRTPDGDRFEGVFTADYCPSLVRPRAAADAIHGVAHDPAAAPSGELPAAPVEAVIAGMPVAIEQVTLVRLDERTMRLSFLERASPDPCQSGVAGPISVANNGWLAAWGWSDWREVWGPAPAYFRIDIPIGEGLETGRRLTSIASATSQSGLSGSVRWIEPGNSRMATVDEPISVALELESLDEEAHSVSGRIYLAAGDRGRSFMVGGFSGAYCPER